MIKKNQDSQVNPRRILEFLKESKELVAFVALTLMSVATALFGPNLPLIQTGSWIVATLFVAGGTLVWYRIRKRKANRAQVATRRGRKEADATPRAAFRSLSAFEERDDLPGSDRKIEARTIATRIASDDFRFGVVCGDIGCGKTSMLRSELSRVLRQSDMEVAYVRNYRRIESSSQDAAETARLAVELRTITTSYIKPTTRVLILDQFEEWLKESRGLSLRQQIGRFIGEMTQNPSALRVVVAVRPESLIDVHDLTDAVGESLSSRNLFHIEYFRVEQAIDVIRQCAHADGVDSDETFAQLVARELAEDGQVRPTELQIVCTYLAVTGSLNTSEYRKSGGRAAILAHYIKDALLSSKSPELAARLLRALSDFPTRAKRKPKTVDELALELENVTSSSGAPLRSAIHDVARHFVSSQILAEEQIPNRDLVFGLVHDYVVDAVQLATSDISTKTEEANQLLKYYITEKDIVIPLRKISFIKKFAERRYLDEPVARRVMRKSILAPVGQVGSMIVLAVFCTAVFYLIVTSRTQWQTEVLGRHWSDANSSGAVRVIPITDGRLVTTGGNQVRVWDAKTGNLLITIENPGLTSVLLDDLIAKFALLYNAENRETAQGTRLIDLSTGETTDLTLPATFRQLGFTASQSWLTWAEGEPRVDSPFSITMASVANLNAHRKIAGFRYPSRQVPSDVLLFTLNNLGERLVVLSRVNERDYVQLVDVRGGRVIATIAGTEAGIIQSYSVNEPTSRVCTAVLMPSGVLLIRMWDLFSGLLLDEARISLRDFGIDPGSEFSVDFNPNGNRLRLFKLPSEGGPPLLILSASNLEILKDVPVYQKKLFRTMRSQEILAWREGQGTKVWDVDKEEPKVISDLELTDEDICLVNSNNNRLLVFQAATGELELRDFSDGRRIARLPHAYPLVFWKFTLDDNAIMTVEEGDLLSLFDARTGAPIFQYHSVGVIREAYYDHDCRRMYLWNATGQVLRYTKGRTYFGKFIRSQNCTD
jgi:WD40 repeat protein